MDLGDAHGEEEDEGPHVAKLRPPLQCPPRPPVQCAADSPTNPYRPPASLLVDAEPKKGDGPPAIMAIMLQLQDDRCLLSWSPGGERLEIFHQTLVVNPGHDDSPAPHLNAPQRQQRSIWCHGLALVLAGHIAGRSEWKGSVLIWKDTKVCQNLASRETVKTKQKGGIILICVLLSKSGHKYHLFQKKIFWPKKANFWEVIMMAKFVFKVIQHRTKVVFCNF